MAGHGKIENLRPPWRPGESGNPAGRPRRRPISDAYDELLQRLAPEKLRRELDLSEGATYADALAATLINAACKGRVAEAREIREAVEGKAGERPKEISGPIEIRITYDDPPKIRGVDPKTKDPSKTPEES
jgi:hypothetical protein